MPKGTMRRSPPTGLARLAARLPVWLYRLHLGWLLGDRFVMLIHTGRRSGLPRRVVLEVVRHDRASDTYVVASGWGEKADWFRNIQHNPHVRLRSGGRGFDGTAVRLTLDDAAREVCDYARRHPRAFAALFQFITGQRPGGTEADCRALAEVIPLVAIRPRN